MHNMFRAIRRVLDEHPDVKAIYPIHMNPVAWKAADEKLGDCDRIHIIEPIEVDDWGWDTIPFIVDGSLLITAYRLFEYIVKKIKVEMTCSFWLWTTLNSIDFCLALHYNT